MKTWLTVAEGAEYAGVSRDTIYTNVALLSDGDVCHDPVGGCVGPRRNTGSAM